MTNFFLEVKNVVKFWVTILKPIVPGENRQKICHQKSTPFFTPKISKSDHLEVLGPLSCKRLTHAWHVAGLNSV